MRLYSKRVFKKEDERMKKLLAFVLTLAMGVSLVACGGGSKPAGSEASKAPEASAAASEAPAGSEAAAGSEASKPAAELNAGVFYYDFADAYISTVRDEMDKQLKEMGVKFTNYDAAGSQPTQTDSIKTALSQGCNLLIVNIVETTSKDAAQEIVNAAKDANIPVIFFNREVADEVVKSYDKCAFVGTDAPEAGHLEGEMIGDYLMANYDKTDLNKDGKISYVLFKGQEGNAEAEARTKFAVEDADKILEKGGKPALEYYDPNAASKFLVDKDGKWSAAAANDYMTGILGTYSEANKNMVELVIANNDDMALGALSALQNAGYNKEGSKVTIPIFGVDATASAQGKIKAGEMTGSVKQDNVGMATTICALVKNVKEGKPLMDGTDKFNVDKGVAKIRVPYQKWTGKE